MEDRDWLILKTIYEEKNMSKAAQVLHVSQPALTYRLQQLETEFNTKIVHRSNKGVEFTGQGEYLAKYAVDMLNKLRMTKEIVESMENKVQGTLRLGVSRNFARYNLPPLLSNFLTKYPDIKFHLITGFSSEITDLVYKEEFHIGIIRGNNNWKEQKLLLAQEPVCIVSKSEIDSNSLPALPRIHYETEPSLQSVINNWWEENFTQPPFITMRVDRIDTCKEMVKNGLGYAIVPKACLTEDDILYQINLTTRDQKEILRDTWVIYRNSSLELTMIRAFIDFIKSIKQEGV
ncbi:DNA-binding transcriptional LysR family regulator [Bacillus oleivorans]|uniref:DNA-binding transcriptional LysR family regulator n=1 Tax=Bacillus oleivorans TaxID=1448271 RepID=A0A285D6R1_9BACI|nr:LysR family transcriptional regulator [Bacillus oleivorans]SNX75524.1 DNA-binding transcriptional LysR family regulator [Bacillus oleivorans]